MNTYQDFKRKDEAVEISNPSQDIESQIDALFDELKKKVRDLENPEPRQSYADRVKAWYDSPKVRQKMAYNPTFRSLESYNYLQQFKEALSVSDIESVLDEYKEKLKQMLRTMAASQPASQAPKPVTPVAKPPVAPKMETPPIAKPPVAPKMETPPIAKPPVAPPSKPKMETPPIATPKSTPVTAPASAPAENPEEDKLVRLGYAVLLTRKMLDITDVSQDDIDYVLSQPFDHKYKSSKEKCIKAAKEYQQSQGKSPISPAKSDINTPVSTNPTIGPIPNQPPVIDPLEVRKWAKTKSELRDMSDEEFKKFVMDSDPDGVPITLGHYDGENSPTGWWDKVHRGEAINELPTDLIKSKKSKLPPMPPPPDDGTLPTREQLLAMKPQQFKSFLLEHDPDLAKSYEGQPWENRSFRTEIVDSLLHFWDVQDNKAKTDPNQMPMESLQHKVNKYKEMLQQSNRPELLLQEAAKIPFTDRVKFYKKKLNCHDMSSTI